MMNTVLGNDASATDKLHVMGNTSGQANVAINNVNGNGANTVDGIKIVQVDGRSDGQFDLAGRAVGGFYEYFLFKGGKTDPNDGDWYLRSELKDPPTVVPCTTPIICKDPPTVVPCTTPFVCNIPIIVPCTTPIICDAPVIEPPPPRPRPVLRPEVGAYLANQSAAVDLFQQAMHDRLGEPGLAERLKSDDTLNSAWVRTAGDQADYGPLAKQLEISSHRSLLQIGTDLARWGQSSRGQIGVMAATGQANNTVVSNLTGYTAKGKVEGTALGVYANWFANPAGSTGAYVDGWVQYGRFKNSVHGEGLQKEKYDARTMSGSVESGYAFRVFEGERSAVLVEPQAQLTYTDYRGGGTTEHNGTVVASEKAGGLSARTGVRIYGHDRTEQGHLVQPFASVNWLHDRSRNAMSFDGAQMAGGVPRDRYEVNAGVQLQVSNRWSGWGSLGLQSGANDYRNAGAQLGAKYSW
jgi:autotransporter family porin